MNYRHIYHAGNFSDVIKHITLIALLTSLTRKDTPFCYIDTHAGSAFYDLFSESSAKTKEYENGVEKIIQADDPPPLVKKYLDCVRQANNKLTHTSFSSLRYYPGSPLIAKQIIRSHDRIIACELQLQEYQSLKSTCAGDRQITTLHLDGFIGLKSLIPPREKRGLVLIDPPYENPDEFVHLAHSLAHAIKKWETGIYAIWYPIKEKSPIARFYQSLKQHSEKPILAIELNPYPDLPNHLNGCGLAIINPPWQCHEAIQSVLPWLWKTLSIDQQGNFKSDLIA
jgi:23S rRNA (adenine2030-N6)-methyltransferase